MLEWPDLKAVPADSTRPMEQIGCWSTGEATIGEHASQYTLLEQRVNLTMWPLPEHIRPVHPAPREAFLSFECVRVRRRSPEARSSLVAFDQDDLAKTEWIGAITGGSARTTRMVPPPDAVRPVESLLCLDDTFYMRASDFPASPFFAESNGTSRKYTRQPFGDVDQLGWTEFGQYLRFLPRVHAMADELLRDLLRLSSRQSIPPTITVHLRRGDFGNGTVIEPFVTAVDDIRRQLDQSARWRGRGHEFRVIAATDETDEAFLGEMRGHGWHVLDHTALRTEERFGTWGPPSVWSCG